MPAVPWLVGRDEAREYRTLRTQRNKRRDLRQHPVEPRHCPFGLPGKYPLHVDADMDGAIAGRSVFKGIGLGHVLGSNQAAAELFGQSQFARNSLPKQLVEKTRPLSNKAYD